MKNFSNFIKEAKFSLASQQAKRHGLSGDGKGSFYNPKTGEFVAKNEGGKLKWYTGPGEKVGEKDPPITRTINNSRPVSTQTRRPPKKNSVTTEVPEQISRQEEKELREKYIAGQIFCEGTFVENIKTHKVGKIVRRGTNHLICVTEDDEMFKSWIRDVREWTEVSGVPADQRLVGTDAHREYAMRMTGTKKIRNFINKYKAKKKH